MNALHAEEIERREGAAETLMFLLLAGAAMLFATFTAAYLIRRAGPDWSPVSLPWTTWLAAGVLALSSATLHRRLLKATLALGLAFAALQGIAFAQLSGGGVMLPSSPHASFFYMLAGVHGAHVLGGLIGLGAAIAGRVRLGLVAAWWHFVGGLWIYALVMLEVL